MSEEKIPTVEELIAIKTGQSLPLKRNLYLLVTGDVIDLVKEVTKLHVEAALKAASEKATIKEYLEGDPMGGKVVTEVDKESILTAYPLENIK